MKKTARQPAKKIASNKDMPVISFPLQKDLRSWMVKNHQKSPGIWIKFYKKDAGVTSITYAEALDIALCYGWIDGQAKPSDDQSWLRKFTPRRPGSIWSKKNRDHIARLQAGGKMKPAGIKEVEEAKADGRWEQAYDSQANMTVPEDLLTAVKKNKKAHAFFLSLNKANTYAIVWRLQTAKKAETRTKRLNTIIDMLKKGEKFHP